MYTIEELNKIKNEAKLEKERRDLAIELNICPICDAPIIEQKVEIFEKPNCYLFGLIQIWSRKWDSRKVCSANKKHYEVKEDYTYENYEY